MIFVIRNAIEMEGIGIRMFWGDELENEVTK